MNSRQSLSGEELFKLYLEDKENDHLKDPQNLKLLLNYALNNMKDMIDSNLEFDIVDYCVERLKKDTDLDDEKIQYYRDKYNIIEKQRESKRRHRKYATMAATAALFVVIVGVLFFKGGMEGKAGVFDWVESLIIKDEGEQLVIKTPNMTLKGIEIKEGHLPDALPDEFIFLKHRTDSSSLNRNYNYHFIDTNDNILIIEIIEYTDDYALNSHEFEIRNNSYKEIIQDDQSYFYSSNESNNCISWIYNKKIYVLRGIFEFTKLEEILSFYQKDQVKK